MKRLLSVLLWLGALMGAPAMAADPAQRVAWREQAQAFEHGEGVPRDAQRAAQLYCQAALAGDAVAAYNLGWMYANGRGLPRHDGYAAHFFARAALLGDDSAQRMFDRLGVLADKPECVAQAERASQEQAQAQQEAAEAQARAQRYRLLADTPEKQRILKLVDKLAPQYGIHPGLAFAVIRAESNFDAHAVSEKNAQGLMQLIPETAERFAVRKPFDAEQNIRGGLAYLRWLLAYFKGQVPLALAAYNAGEGTVDRYRGVPPFPETRGYIRRIQDVFGLEQHPYDERVAPTSPLFALK